MINFVIFLPDEVKKILDKFYKRKEIQKLGADYGLDGNANEIPLEIFIPFWVTALPVLCSTLGGLDTRTQS